MTELEREDIIDDVVVIKVGKSYRENMSETELYDITRGCWKRKIESVQKAKYALCVYKSEVKEVYSIDSWKPAHLVKRETIPYSVEADSGRIAFDGEIAPDEVRKRYVGKSVAKLYKWGEADPVKTFYKDVVQQSVKTDDINVAIKPGLIIQTDDKPLIICPRCEYDFDKAPRCPECGQLIDYGTEKWNKPSLRSLDEWIDNATIEGASPSSMAYVVKSLSDSFDSVEYRLGAVDISLRYVSPKNKVILQLFMFFGKSESGAVQPKAGYDFARENGLDEELIKDYLDALRPFLSEKQKNTPFEREEGYYFLSYKRIDENKDGFIDVVRSFVDKLNNSLIG